MRDATPMTRRELLCRAGIGFGALAMVDLFSGAERLLRADESPSATGTRSSAWMRRTARSVSGSSPTRWAGTLRPSARVAVSLAAPATTWLFVRRNPSGVNRNPEPEPPSAGRPRRRPRPSSWPPASIFTTDGETDAATPATVVE